MPFTLKLTRHLVRVSRSLHLAALEYAAQRHHTRAWAADEAADNAAQRADEMEARARAAHKAVDAFVAGVQEEVRLMGGAGHAR